MQKVEKNKCQILADLVGPVGDAHEIADGFAERPETPALALQSQP